MLKIQVKVGMCTINLNSKLLFAFLPEVHNLGVLPMIQGPPGTPHPYGLCCKLLICGILVFVPRPYIFL